MNDEETIEEKPRKKKVECLHYGLCKSVIAGVNHDPDCPLFRDYSHATLDDTDL